MVVLLPLIFLFSSLSFASDISVPSIVTRSSDSPFLMDKKFAGSCGSEGQILPNDVANKISSGGGEDYFFFSLTQYLSDIKKQKAEYRFFKEKKLTGKPDFILNETGFIQNGKNICKWRLKYEESHLYANNLEKCFQHGNYGDSDVPVVFQSIGSPQGAIEVCSILRVYRYTVENGKYSYQVQINGEPYYLDVANMPKLQNGESFYSGEKLALQEYKNDSERAHRVARAFVNIKDTPAFQELFKCVVNKDTSCLDNYWTKEFYESVLEAGYDPICTRVKDPSKETPVCGKDHDIRIREIIYSHLVTIVDDINKMNTENYISDGFNISYKVKNTHARMEEAFIHFKVIDGKIYLESFVDGLTC